MRLQAANKEKEQAEKATEELRQKAQEEHDYENQEKTQSHANPVEPFVPSSSIAGGNQVLASRIELIPFTPTEEDEVPDLNTIFYDKAKKRIVKRIEKKVKTGGKRGVMVTEKALDHGTDRDLRLMARASVAIALATEDNVDRIMTDLE